ncbi:MAG: helix-turn-helix domain-containing protein [Opitutaceae bacterium]|nr:helix-turn-helix domain-containing protein [Opitutaceae bacterium]
MQTIGERLEEARKRKGISIREASEATKIRSDYLQKFESNSYELNLPDIYVRGFLRSYAQYLKLNTEKLLTDYASLGLGTPRDARDTRRQEPRESFGRIDLADSGKGSSSPASLSPENGAARNLPQQARSVPTSVVTGAPSADRKQKYRTRIIVGGAAFALLLLILLLRAVLPSDSDRRPSPTPAGPRPEAAAIPSENLMRLAALDNVHVKVTQQVDRREIVLFEGDLLAGQTHDIEKRGKVIIAYNVGKNLKVYVGGQPYNMTVPGEGRNRFD